MNSADVLQDEQEECGANISNNKQKSNENVEPDKLNFRDIIAIRCAQTRWLELQHGQRKHLWRPGLRVPQSPCRSGQ